MPNISEHQIQNQIINYLRLKHYYVDRMNSGKMRQRDARGKMYFIQLHPVGTPDLLAFKNIREQLSSGEWINRTYLFFIEVKAPGNKPTRLQNIKMEELARYGATCIVAYSIDDLMKKGI